MRIWVGVALALAACSGTAGVRDHSETLALATHCGRHACAPKPSPVNLGDGCYAVDYHLYQCSADGPGDASCFEVSPCAEVCENTVRDGRGMEISTKRCEALWSDYQQAHRPPPTCKPVDVSAIGAGTAYPRSKLVLADALALEVMRSGKDRVLYEAQVCATDHGAVVGDPIRTTGFAGIDTALRGELAKVVLSPGQCSSVTLQASPFDCF